MAAKFAVLAVVFLHLRSHQVCSAVPTWHSDNKYKLLRLHASTEEDLRLVHNLQDSLKLDPWRQVWRVNSSGDYMVSPQNLASFRKQLTDGQIHHQVLIQDVAKFLQNTSDPERRSRSKRSTSAQDFRHQFLSYPEIRQFLRLVKDTATNAKVELGSIGRTWEGRPTPYVKISSGNSSALKDILFIDGGIHSREWISPAMTLEVIHRLAFNTEKDSAIKKLLNVFDWLIVPLVNPDGYVLTFKPGLENRLWRKSRSKAYTNDPYCYGVDLNRNFGFEWNNTPIHGGSSNPCSGTFSGSRSFSEPETQNLRNLLLSHKERIRGYLSFHSFGQFFLYPWGYSSDVDIDDEADLYHVASAFANTMKAKNYQYHVGGSAKVLYPAAGASDDYVRGTIGVKYAYTVELPPHESSTFGFLLPESSVSSVVTDTWEGLKAFAYRLYAQILRSSGAPADFSAINKNSHHIGNSSYETDYTRRLISTKPGQDPSKTKSKQTVIKMRPWGTSINKWSAAVGNHLSIRIVSRVMAEQSKGKQLWEQN